DVLEQPQIAIVGSRKATHYGREAAFRIARGLAEHGVVVTSGMAAGIDAAAHRGALAAGWPTLAVFGCGIDRTYPRHHTGLAAAIADAGALVSEFPLGAAPRPHHFPRRNRIISGLCLGTVVVEAALKSGSMTTAQHALDQSRDVFAVPGSVRNPLAAGCHALIQQGAVLINDHADVLAQYPDRLRSQSTAAGADVPESADSTAVTEHERYVLDACAWDGASFDEIVHRSGLTAPDVSSILSALEVRGAVRSLAGNTYLRIAE
ncbi:MAG: DNA-processing protein DprA, partial [Gammaproteobacteria bacterium]